MRKKTESLESLEAQRAVLAEKIRARKEQTAVRYGMPFVEKMSDKIGPRIMAKLANYVAASGIDQAIKRLS